MTYVSPHYTREEVDAGKVDDIDIFRDQIEGWLFAQADRLRGDEHASVAILSLVTPYFETIACYLKGAESKGQSTDFLKDGLREVFPGTSDAAVDAFATEVRNGLFHESVFRTVGLHHGATGLPSIGMHSIEGKDRLVLDPWFLLDAAKAHLATFVRRLRDQPKEAALLASFKAFMKIRWDRWKA